MKRSEINQQIDFARSFFDKHSFLLPAWANLCPEEWKTKANDPDFEEIRLGGLGWDITDFSKGHFKHEGLTLFTIRNGYPSRKPDKVYCEKIMISEENQVTPMHFHWNKMEDIINRGGGSLCIEVWQANNQEEKTTDKVVVKIDGVVRTFKAGDIVRLKPGESICFEPYVYHSFWGEGGAVLIGEVSMVNDDSNDNRFFEPLGRYPKIFEDEQARYMLCNEYQIA
jgi:D-lyxose ketol-isomerase